MEGSSNSTSQEGGKELEDVLSDLLALRKLYGLVYQRTNVEDQGKGRESSDDKLDKNSINLLKKLLDDATRQAIQSHANFLFAPPNATPLGRSPDPLVIVSSTNVNPPKQSQVTEELQNCHPCSTPTNYEELLLDHTPKPSSPGRSLNPLKEPQFPKELQNHHCGLTSTPIERKQTVLDPTPKSTLPQRSPRPHMTVPPTKINFWDEPERLVCSTPTKLVSGEQKLTPEIRNHKFEFGKTPNSGLENAHKFVQKLNDKKPNDFKRLPFLGLPVPHDHGCKFNPTATTTNQQLKNYQRKTSHMFPDKDKALVGTKSVVSCESKRPIGSHKRTRLEPKHAPTGVPNSAGPTKNSTKRKTDTCTTPQKHLSVQSNSIPVLRQAAKSTNHITSRVKRDPRGSHDIRRSSTRNRGPSMHRVVRCEPSRSRSPSLSYSSRSNSSSTSTVESRSGITGIDHNRRITDRTAEIRRPSRRATPQPVLPPTRHHSFGSKRAPTGLPKATHPKMEAHRESDQNRTSEHNTNKRRHFKRIKDKLSIIFHHNHHHYHHLHNHDDNKTIAKVPNHHHHRSLWKYLSDKVHHTSKVEGTVERVVEKLPRQHHHKHFHALLDGLVHHLWHSKRGKKGLKKISKKKGSVGGKKLHWWQKLRRHGGIKLANRKKPRLRLGYSGKKR